MTPNTNSRASSPCAAGASVTPFASAQPKTRRKWTIVETAKLEGLYEAGFTPTRLAVIFDTTVGAINAKLTHMATPRRLKYRSWTNAELRKAQTMRKAGMTYTAIGECLDRTKTSVRNALITYGAE